MKKMLAGLLPLLLCAAAQADGLLDPGFGPHGVAIDIANFDGAGRSEDAWALAARTDGRVLAVGRMQNAFSIALAQLRAQGSLDPAFGLESNPGQQTYAGGVLWVGNSVYPWAAALDASGRPVVAGGATTTIPDTAVRPFVVRCVSAACREFFTDVAQVDMAPSGVVVAAAYAVAVQADGKIVLAGPAQFNDGDWDMFVARFNADLSVDTDFGLPDGLVRRGYTFVSFDLDTSRVDEANALIVQPDGAIVVAGTAYHTDTYSDFAVARLLGNGNVDFGFGDGGAARVHLRQGHANVERALSLARDSHGRLVVAGYSSLPDSLAGPDDSDFAALRLLADGTPDMAFGVGGVVLRDWHLLVGNSDDRCYGVAVQRDDAVVLAGYANTSGSFRDIAVMRLLANGAEDANFGGPGGGISVNYGDVTQSDSDDVAHAVALDRQQRVVVAGSTNYFEGVGHQRDFYVVRLTSDDLIFADGVD